jgi:SOS-response transcriptional repressor LexA
MGTGETGQTTLWREIEELLANAREARPLHHSEALLDIARLTTTQSTLPLIVRLAEALEDWDGRLLVAQDNDALAPTLRSGDRLVVDWQLQPDEGDLVIAFAGGTLVARALTWQDGRQWLLGNDGCAPIPLGPEVGILGVIVEVRRPVHRCAVQRQAA